MRRLAVRTTVALALVGSALASHAAPPLCESPEAPKARAIMARIEADFRTGARIVRMKINTSYREGHRLEGYFGDDCCNKTLWGVVADAETQTQLLYVFSGPGRLSGTTLLMHDRKGSMSDDALWLYLRSFDSFNLLDSSAQRVYVPGTALSYEDSRGFIPVDKYRFSFLGAEPGEGPEFDLLACPRSEAIAKDLGYGHLRLRVDSEKGIVRSVEYRDVEDGNLKRYRLNAEQQVGKRWFPEQVVVEHEANGMVTAIAYEYWLPPAEALPQLALFEPSIEKTKFLERLRVYLREAGHGERIDAEIAVADEVIRKWDERWSR
jgi:hypothetical protein